LEKAYKRRVKPLSVLCMHPGTFCFMRLSLQLWLCAKDQFLVVNQSANLPH